ncbi:MAG: hypothetical protein CMJ06_04255, partial [Pelagibacterales bacterium]
KKAVQNNSPLKVIFIVIMSQLIFFSMLLVFSDFTVLLNKYVRLAIVLIFLNVLSLFLFLLVLKSGEVSIYIPMLSFTPFFSAMYSKLILNEELVLIQYLGMVLIILGSLFLHSSQFKSNSLIIITYSFLRNKKSLMILTVALIWSLTPVLDKECLKYTDLYLHGFIQAIGMITVLPLLLFNKKISLGIFKEKIHHNFLLYLIIIIGFLTTFTQLIALKDVYVAELESLKRGIGIILSLFFGYFFFHEKINLKKILSVLVIIIGVINIVKFT